MVQELRQCSDEVGFPERRKEQSKRLTDIEKKSHEMINARVHALKKARNMKIN